ncbi:MAG: thioredoxin family protein [Candidatus Bathyarchaeota archaeon]|nr:thioredoxin family protein [Candidatus Bathyarchaeota archaeon]
MSNPIYYDKREEFWRKHWTQASEYHDFIQEQDQSHAEKWRNIEQRLPELTPEQIERLQGYNRELNILIYGGIWCPDCQRQAPMIKKLTETIGPKAHIKIIDRDTSQELKDELRILGATRVPMIVILTEDFWEVGRYGDRLLNVYRAKAAREIGRGPNAGVLSPKAMEAEMNEWVDIIERAQIMLRLSPPLRRRHND